MKSLVGIIFEKGLSSAHKLLESAIVTTRIISHDFMEPD